jgi:transcriptional regulator GlxA family with amidase domain
LEGDYASTAIAPVEVFHSAGRLWNTLQGETAAPRFRVRIASLDGRSVTSNCGLVLKPELGLQDIRHTDIIILSASRMNVQERIAKNSPLLPWLRKWYARGTYIASICSAAAFLAECGLLDGRQATSHWGVAENLRQRYPKVHWHEELFVTEDRGIFCSGGLYASIDLSLYLVEKFCGHEIALQCAKSLLVSMPRSNQSGYAVTSLTRPHSDDRIREVEEYLQSHFARGLPMESLAGRFGMSPRNFIRRFKAATGRLPGAYVQSLRIASAKEMLEQGKVPVQTICTKIGYEDIAFFRNVFKRHTGMTPAEYRIRFAGMRFDRGRLAAGHESVRN